MLVFLPAAAVSIAVAAAATSLALCPFARSSLTCTHPCSPLLLLQRHRLNGQPGCERPPCAVDQLLHQRAGDQVRLDRCANGTRSAQRQNALQRVPAMPAATLRLRELNPRAPVSSVLSSFDIAWRWYHDLSVDSFAESTVRRAFLVLPCCGCCAAAPPLRLGCCCSSTP